MTSLEDDLRALGRSAAVPPVAEGLAAAVLERVAEPPVRRTVAAAVKEKWRALLALLSLLLAGALVAPPVRAAVAEWLNIGGVGAVQVPSGPTSAPAPPQASGQLSMVEAARKAGFTPVVPTALGAPTGVQASTGFVAMSWETADGVVRLEQFQAEPSPLYFKKYYSELEHVPEIDGFWFSTPHELVLMKQTGEEQRVRVAGPTLVWVRNGITFRLEGMPDKNRATELAR
ncbi:hypothetical protein [Kribbella catacumbae]|uniref:hypothetical protein n=1 Tax=Kribbella catacumbae TaxID=460086 RepID=UPI00035F11AC|nr:hypothetical protein [Kribbella catacumbae]